MTSKGWELMLVCEFVTHDGSEQRLGAQVYSFFAAAARGRRRRRGGTAPLLLLMTMMLLLLPLPPASCPHARCYLFTFTLVES